MKTIIAMFVFLLSVSALAGDEYVRGYVRRDGTYVQPHHRTTPDNTVNNNYGTVGNYNPYTGDAGTRPRRVDESRGTYNYGNNEDYGIRQKSYGSDDE